MKRLAILLVALAVVALIAITVQALRNMGSLQEKWLRGLANDLITTTNSPRLLYIGAEPKARIAELLASPTGVAAIEHGDAPAPFGDGSAIHYVILTNTQGKQLGLRLRPAVSNTLEIIGYWTPK